VLPNTVGFGAIFGNSRGFSYLSVPTTAGTTGGVKNTTSITITFAEALKPKSFGIAIGDIDGERVAVSMKDGSGATIDPDVMGIQPAFNWSTGAQSANLGETNILQAEEKGTTWEVFDPRCTPSLCRNTNGATTWFWPDATVKEITIDSTIDAGGNAVYQLWLAYTATQVVTWDPETDHLLTDNSLTVSPTDATNTLPPAGGGTITYSVDPSSTSDCALTNPNNPANSPEFTASKPGSCIITATAAATSDFLEGTATVTFQITTPPAPSLPDKPRPTPASEQTLEETVPLLAATGSPSWPLWAAMAGTIGAGLVVFARLTTHSKLRAPRLN
jgi:hypothetical protein